MNVFGTRRSWPILLPVAFVVGLGAALIHPQPTVFPDDPRTIAEQTIAEHLRSRIEYAASGLPITVGEEVIHATVALPLFYEQRLYQPAWVSPRGPRASAGALIAALRGVEAEGLRSEDYHLAGINALIRRLERGALSRELLSDLDLLLTDAFLICGAHLVSGRINPETFDPEWVAIRREVDLVAVLTTALDAGRPAEALRDLLPRSRGYLRLRDGLARYRKLAHAGGWPQIADGPSLHEGDADLRAVALRRRLWITGDLPPGPSPQSEIFDAELVEAVRHFQLRHGLDVDGVMGTKTLAALNVSAEERVRQIELNLERWRWLPQDLGARYLVVNIPDFRLEVVEEGRPVLAMRAVVGRRHRRTPVFSDLMRYLVLNPSWEVPPRLAVEDKLPEILRDPEYLARFGFRVYQGWGSERREIDPQTVDWSLLRPGNFPYRLHQVPGPQNALGRIKFMFPNKFNVYLHDTPARELFLKAERDFSSGCIRIEKPLELAEYLLAEAGWNRDRLLRALEGEQDKTIPLPKPIAVHLEYWTAWVDEQGTAHFRIDLYGRDAQLAAALGRVAAAAREQ